MQIIARRTLKQFWEKHPEAEIPLRVWYARVNAANWASPADVKAMFGSTIDFVADNRIIFDLGGNKFRLIVHVAYSFRRVLIKFVVTYKDYDRINAETV
jgi:mRNA interferase HigB